MCPSPQIRDVVLASGMERGMRETMDQLQGLATLLASEPRVEERP